MSLTVTTLVERTLMMPTIPNFIRTIEGEAISIDAFSQEQLEQIGKQWTDALKQKARDKAKGN